MKGIFAAAVAAMALLASCGSVKDNAAGGAAAFTVADGYFLRNDRQAADVPPMVADSKTFGELFGMAAVMGPDGKPTPVDFSKEIVIAVAKPATSVATEIAPVRLEMKAGGVAVFTYRVATGETRSYTTQPLLLVVARRDGVKAVELKEAD